MTTATAHIYADIGHNRLQQGLALWYLFFWLLTGISPVDRRDWLLENFLVLVFSGLLVATYRRFPLSDVSYVLITIFLTLHSIGAHYTYAQVPIGTWVKEVFHQGRNHYDRLVHFSFGLMLAYPARELFLRVANARGFWAYYLPLDVILALSAMYEISPEDGTLLRRFELGDRAALGVACVHDRKFLSIDYVDGKIIPLVGSAESEPTADQPGTVFPPKN